MDTTTYAITSQNYLLPVPLPLLALALVPVQNVVEQTAKREWIPRNDQSAVMFVEPEK